MNKRRNEKTNTVLKERNVKEKTDSNLCKKKAFKFLFKYGLCIYNLICVGLTFYFVYHQLKKYLDNDDVSSFVITEINQTPKDGYPAYTLCLEGDPSTPSAPAEDMYNRMYLNKAFNFTGIEIWGCKPKRWTKSGWVHIDHKEVCIYRGVLDARKGVLEKISPQDVAKISEIDFEKALKTTDKFLKRLETLPKKEKEGKLKGSNFPFYKSSQNPNQVCYTRKDEEVGSKKLVDMMHFDLKWMVDKGRPKFRTLTVYVHPPGRFYRERRQVAKIPLRKLNTFNDLVNIEIVDITKVRNRVDGEQPCNPDYDQFNDTQWIKDAVEFLKCVPPYWKSFYQEQNSTFGSCKTKKDLRRASEFTGTLSHKNVNMTQKNKPCDKLSFSTSVRAEAQDICPEGMERTLCKEKNHEASGPILSAYTPTSKLMIRMTFPEEEYTEIRNSREFGPESLGAGIGGYVGICVGCSLMQLPSLFVESIKMFYAKI